MGWGGKRKGAGRPASGPKKKLMVVLPIDLLAAIDEKAKKISVSRSQAIALAIKEYLNHEN